MSAQSRASENVVLPANDAIQRLSCSTARKLHFNRMQVAGGKISSARPVQELRQSWLCLPVTQPEHQPPSGVEYTLQTLATKRQRYNAHRSLVVHFIIFRALLEHCDCVRRNIEMSDIRYREATTHDDNTVAECFVKMWQGIGVPEDCFDPDKIQQTLDFLQEARNYDLKTYMAEHNGRPIGSASGHLFHGLYPSVINKKRSVCCTFASFDSNKLVLVCLPVSKLIELQEAGLHLGCLG